jgi:hypothetical protein
LGRDACTTTSGTGTEPGGSPPAGWTRLAARRPTWVVPTLALPTGVHLCKVNAPPSSTGLYVSA